MEKNKKIASISYLVTFLVVVVLLGLLSFAKLMGFYLFDKVDYNEWNAELGNKFETDEASNFFEKIEFVNFNGFVRNLLGQREMNGVVKLDNGYLFTTFPRVEDAILVDYANRVSNLKSYLDEQGIELLYAQTPYTVNKYDPQMPVGIEDYGNENVDRFIALLKERDINVLDFRETMHEDGIDQYDMMYKTDHHWTTEAGFYAFTKLQDYLSKVLNCEVDPRIADINNYTVTNYKKWHLGTRGQRTGRFYGGIDDFKLIEPNFDIQVSNGENTGTINDIVIQRDALQNTDYTFRYTYDSVQQGSMLSDFKCLDCKNDKKILMVTDSFGYAVNPYMIMGFSEVRTIRDGETQKLTKSYIKDYNPDAIVLMYYPSLLTDGDAGFRFISD